jgi:hypothetical protein
VKNKNETDAEFIDRMRRNDVLVPQSLVDLELRLAWSKHFAHEHKLRMIAPPRASC